MQQVRSCSTDPVCAVAKCMAVHHGDTQCLQPARSRGYCVFHDLQLRSMSEPSSYAPCIAMPRSSVGCLNLYDTSLLVRSDHYCRHCGVYSECVFLSGNGLRHLVIYAIDEESDIYAVAGNISPGHYKPAWSYGVSDLGSNVSLDSECLISICAAMFGTNHTIGPPCFLRYCSKVCYDSDNATASARFDLVRDVSVVAPPLGSGGARVVSQTPSATDAPRMSLAMQHEVEASSMYMPLPDDTRRILSASRHRVGDPRSHSSHVRGVRVVRQDISDSNSEPDSEPKSIPDCITSEADPSEEHDSEPELGSISDDMDTDTNSAVRADWSRPPNLFDTNDEDAMADCEDECLSSKQGVHCLVNAPPHKRIFISRDSSHDQHRCESAYYVRAAQPMSTRNFHLRSDANALDTAGRQD